MLLQKSSTFSLALTVLLTLSFSLSTQAQAGAEPNATAAASTPVTFRVVTTPNISSVASLAADSADDIWAVPISSSPVSLHFDGKNWNSIPMANTGNLSGVTVVNSSDVWAVGQGHTASVSKIQHFDGNRWKVVSSPHFTSGEVLAAVQAVSANNIFAVGGFVQNRFLHPLIEHFDGTSWSVVATPAAPLLSASLGGIAVISPSDIWAVGGMSTSDTRLPLAMHFDGKAWSLVSVPAPALGVLNAVTAVSTDDVWAVGNQTPLNGGSVTTLIEHWNGKSWQNVPSPSPSTFSSLSSVSAVSANDVWATGCGDCEAGLGLPPLVEHFDGTQWTIHQAPKFGFFASGNAVLAFPTGSVFVGGFAIVNGAPQSIVLHAQE